MGPYEIRVRETPWPCTGSAEQQKHLYDPRGYIRGSFRLNLSLADYGNLMLKQEVLGDQR